MYTTDQIRALSELIDASESWRDQANADALPQMVTAAEARTYAAVVMCSELGVEREQLWEILGARRPAFADGLNWLEWLQQAYSFAGVQMRGAGAEAV